MSTIEWQRVDEVFQAARALSGDARTSYLEEACANDSALRSEVESLLGSHTHAAGFLEQPALGPDFQAPGSLDVGETRSHDTGVLSDAIPGYRILKEIHRGGQGVVYQAIQLSTKRKVALKVMLEGPFAGAASKRRFEREIELVGTLRHPNIVPIFDSGVAQGRFFYAMDYIRGAPLSRESGGEKRSIEQTLRLFAKVCSAIDHAHQKGIVHRDLKPSNILVDERGEPYVVDFGLAKVGGAAADASLLVSVTGQVMGTPAYMSPEQAAGRPDEVDMRSDVYALGVILYELLTGKMPYDVTGPMSDVLTRIRQTPPQRPSTIHRKINNELETLVLKALSKEKDRRYYGAGPLADDIERFLADRPIDAKRDSALYVLRKTLHRYKAPVAAALGFVVVISCALVVSLTFWRQASHQRDAADEARTLAELDREELRQRLYASYVSRAGVALRDNRAILMRNLLDGCPEDLRHWEWNYLASLADRSRQTLHGHEGDVWFVRFGPRDDIIRSAAADGTLRIWDSATGQAIDTFAPPLILNEIQGYPRIALDLSADGKRFATSGPNGKISILDAQTGREVRILSGHEAQVIGLSFEPKGHRLVSASTDGTMKLWNLCTDQVRTLTTDAKFVSGIAWEPGGRFIAAVGDRTTWLWDAESLALLRVFQGHQSRVLSVAFGPKGRRFATGGVNRIVRLWDIRRDEALLTCHGHAAPVTCLAFSPDGEHILSGSADGTLKIWHSGTGEELATLRGHRGPVQCLGFSADGRRIVSGGADDTVRTWNVTDAARAEVFRGHEREVRAVALHPSQPHVASVDLEGVLKVWDLRTGRSIASFAADLNSTFAVAYSPDGRYLATGGNDTQVKLWDAATWQRIRTLNGHTDDIWWVTFSPDSQRIASGSRSGSVRVWDVASGQQVFTLSGHSGSVEGVAFSSDGRLIASCDAGDRTLKIWESDTGALKRILRGSEIGIRCAAFSPDGERVACGDGSGAVRVWDVRTGESVLTLRGHGGGVLSVAFSPDGNRIFSGSLDSTLNVWHAQRGELLLTLHGHDGPVFSVAVSPTRNSIVSASNDHTVRAWTAGRAWPVRGYPFDSSRPNM